MYNEKDRPLERIEKQTIDIRLGGVDSKTRKHKMPLDQTFFLFFFLTFVCCYGLFHYVLPVLCVHGLKCAKQHGRQHSGVLGEVTNNTVSDSKVQLTPKSFFHLTCSPYWPDHLCEKIVAVAFFNFFFHEF